MFGYSVTRSLVMTCVWRLLPSEQVIITFYWLYVCLSGRYLYKNRIREIESKVFQGLTKLEQL